MLEQVLIGVGGGVGICRKTLGGADDGVGGQLQILDDYFIPVRFQQPDNPGRSCTL